MKISDLNKQELIKALTSCGLAIKIGPFKVKLFSKIPDIAAHIAFFYGEYQSPDDGLFFDFHITLKKAGGLRRWYKPQVFFYHDEFSPFKPLPYGQAAALFEWGLNWCVASMAHHYYVIHAAVIEKDGRAIILPGMPGAGKSTLCSALCLSGWRLLSDEMTLLDYETFKITPIPRPVSLKNKSIEIIGEFSKDAFIGPAAKDTAKGTVAHLRPLSDSVAESETKAVPHAIVFPRYRKGSDTTLQVRDKSSAFLEIQDNAFNAHILGKRGFDTARNLINHAQCYSLEYSRLDEAISVMDSIMNKKGDCS